MFLIDQLIRDAVKHVLESINKGKMILYLEIILLVHTEHFPSELTFFKC